MDIHRMIDHTLLKPEATVEQIELLCKEAVEYQFKSVCIPPRYIETAQAIIEGSSTVVCTVIGFPLGYQTSEVKAFEAKDAVNRGAAEIDMVIAIGALKDKAFDYVQKDIQAVRDAIGPEIVLKVILETCLLTDEEIIKACERAIQADCDFVKTSTGFSTGGATVEAVSLMKKTVGDRAGVKASGGVRDRASAEKMIEAGATRLGTSSGTKIIEASE